MKVVGITLFTKCVSVSRIERNGLGCEKKKKELKKTCTPKTFSYRKRASPNIFYLENVHHPPSPDIFFLENMHPQRFLFRKCHPLYTFHYENVTPIHFQLKNVLPHDVFSYTFILQHLNVIPERLLHLQAAILLFQIHASAQCYSQ